VERAADRAPCLQSAKDRVYLCRVCGQPKKGHVCAAAGSKKRLVAREEPPPGNESYQAVRGKRDRMGVKRWADEECGWFDHPRIAPPKASSGEGSSKGAGKRTHTDTEADAAGPRKAPRGSPAYMPGMLLRAAEGSRLGELAAAVGGTGAASAARSGGRVETAPLHARENDRGDGSGQGKGKEKAGGEEEVVAQVQTASLPPHQQQPPLPSQQHQSGGASQASQSRAAEAATASPQVQILR